MVNDEIFDAGPVLGIEVTVPALAERCVANIDPQHEGQNGDLAAIEAALEFTMPEGVVTLATIRADLDSLGTMAILVMRQEGAELTEEVMDRVRQIGEADRFARAKRPWEPAVLPTAENPWPAGESLLDALGAGVADFKASVESRVALVRHWLETGKEPAHYREQVNTERQQLIAALADGSIQYQLEGKIAVVESTHRAATYVGSSLAPVVVAVNPNFRQGPGDPYKKFTVAAHGPSYADIRGALAELSTLESGWGGSPTIGGSPQGVSSQLTIEQVVEVVKKYVN